MHFRFKIQGMYIKFFRERIGNRMTLNDELEKMWNAMTRALFELLSQNIQEKTTEK
jgi:hypothetical protein